MNLVECYVTEIVGEPYFEFGFWWQKIKFNSHNVIGETALFNKDKSHFETVNVGFMFLS